MSPHHHTTFTKSSYPINAPLRPTGTPMSPEIGYVQSVPDWLGREQSAISSSNLDCKSAEDSLWFLNLEMVLGLFPNVTTTRFWGTSIWSCSMAWTIFRSVKHGMRPAHRCCWSGTWLSVTCSNRSSKKTNNESNNSRMSSLELAERIWQDFHGHNPHTLLFNPQMCFPFKCDTVFPTV